MKTSLDKRKISRLNCTSLFFLIACLVIPASPQERFRKSPPYPDPLPELSLPEIETATLSNGLGLSVIKRETQPLMQLLLLIRTGESSSPDTAPGMAAFTAQMLERGYEGFSHTRIVEIIESIGGSFSSQITPDYTLFTFSFLEDHLDTALEVLSHMILQPTFPKVEIDNVIRTTYYDLLAKNSSPDFVGKRVLQKILFKNHPYHKIVFDETATRSFNRLGLASFFERYYRPNNAEIILIGNLTLRTAARKVSRYLNTWATRDLEPVSVPPPVPNRDTKICLVDLPGEKDITIYIGNTFLIDDSQEYFPFTVLNQVIGGSPHSRLFMNLRESKGFAYYAFSTVEFCKSCALFTISEKVRPEVISASILESLEEIQRVSMAPIPNYELEQAKSYLIGNFPLGIENFNVFSLKIAEIRAYKLGDGLWSQYYRNLMRIDAMTVFEAARESSLNTPIVVIIGPLLILTERLKGFDLEVYDSKGKHLYSIKQGVLQ